MTIIKNFIAGGTYKKGNTTYPPEVELFVDVFDIAIGDAKRRGTDRDNVIAKKEARKWLLSGYAFWLGSMLFGVDGIILLQGWVKDGAPEPRTARKRKEQYYEEI